MGFLNSGPCLIFPSCDEQICLFEFSSLAVILEHYRCFINMVLLLTVDSLLLFMSLLLSLIPSFFFSSSFSHNLLSSFLFTVSSSRNPITHYFLHSNLLPRCQQKVIVLAIKGKRLLLTICLPKLWVKRLPISNQTVLRRRKGFKIRVVKCYL